MTAARRFRVVAGRPVGNDFADRERHNFLAHERGKPLHSERLLERYDWRAWFADMRDALIAIVLVLIAFYTLESILTAIEVVR